MQYTKNGVTYTFSLDADKIADMEENNPDYDIFSDLEDMQGLKFSVMRRLAGFVGLDFNSMKEKGLDFKDLAEIFKGCIEELGFTSDQPDSNTSLETVA